MSGRSGYRKTARKQTRRPLVVVRSSPPMAPDPPPNGPPSATYPVRLTFLLPDTILTAPGPHGFNVMVLSASADARRSIASA
jgi:hypothetical protein